MDQKQHIIPQVYLREFGYQDMNGVWKVPVINIKKLDLMKRLDKVIISQSNVKSLLRETNKYDIPIIEDKRLLDRFFQLSEEKYPYVIEEIKKYNKLSPNTREYLLGFISHLLVRSNDFRKILDSVIEKQDYPFLEVILEKNQERIEVLFNIPRDSAINLLTGCTAGYVYNCLKHFKVSILNALNDEKWATSDNPVVLTMKANQEKKIDFMGIDSKILCPLSPDFLIYIDHIDSSSQLYNGFESLNENQVNEIEKESFDDIWKRLTNINRISEYLILPTERK